MINLLLGAPGGGKSYEAVAYHLIPALTEGRRVITNLPLILEAFPPEWRNLIELRTRTRKRPPVVTTGSPLRDALGIFEKRDRYNPNPFSNVEDYGNPTPHPDNPDITLHVDPWRHPETGAGPLYIIDECHKPLPRSGTPVEVEEWYAEHRHGRCDVLLMTQSYGKVNKAVIDLVQICYRVRKAAHLGFSNRYIRKVVDGVRGTEMNESVREYDPTFFKYYRSHTQSTTAGKELEAKDIVPIWKHWTFKGAAVCALLFVGIVTFGDVNVLQPKQLTEKPKAQPVTRTVEVVEAPRYVSAPVEEVVAAPVQPVVKSNSKEHPLTGYGLHVSGFVGNESRRMYLFAVSQNGQVVHSMNEEELASAGYQVKQLNECIAEVSFEAVRLYAVCDAPRIGVNPSASFKG